MAVRILGLMSGSSLDGLDMALCRFAEADPGPKWEIEATQTFPYSHAWKERLRLAASLSGKELMKLDAEYGLYIGEQVRQWMETRHIQADVIASHGHTVFHEPSSYFSTQIGSGAHIAALTGTDTITSFRNMDVALGGQGAPLAPVVDRGLFNGYQGYLNLGGIANVTLHSHEGDWKAWDIGPCNQVLNALAEKTGVPYDQDGQIAASGHLLPEMVRDLMAMFPLRKGYAYSLSNEDVQNTWQVYLEKQQGLVADHLASVTNAIASLVIQHISSIIEKPGKVMVTGGGAHNRTLVETLQTLGQPYSVFFILPDPLIIDFKESLLMAYLGYLYLQDRPFGIFRTTGAMRDSIGGAYHKAVK